MVWWSYFKIEMWIIDTEIEREIPRGILNVGRGFSST